MPKRTSGSRRIDPFSVDRPTQEERFTDKPLGNVFSYSKGRMFGAWIDADSRNQGYNANDLIENPVFVIESILRDVLGLTSSSINYASFDDLGNSTSGRRDNWLFARSLTDQQNSLNIIDEIAREAALFYIHDFANQERVVAIDNYSPSTQLANADVIFENGKPQVRVRQTHARDVFNEFYLNYRLNYATGNYDKQLFITAAATNMASNTRNDKTYATYTALCTGSQSIYNWTQRWTFDSKYIRDDATAELFLKVMADWLALRKWEVEATVWYSSKTLKLEALDQVTWNLDLLPASVRDAQVSGLIATPSASGGTLADATYYYVVTGVDVYGETKQSAEVSAVVVGGGGSGKVTLSWTALADAVTYRVYRGTSAGAESVYYSVGTNSYVDTGAASTVGAPPSVASAFFITSVLDYGLKGGGKIKMNFVLCPNIFF